MRCQTHLVGSRDGYCPLAWSPDIAEKDLEALSQLDIGEPRARDMEALATRVTAFCRPLPSGHIALTRCLPGPRDDAGRGTVVFRTIVLSGGLCPDSAMGGLGQLLGDVEFWMQEAFAHGHDVDVASCPSSQPLSRDGALLFDLWLRHHHCGSGPLVLGPDEYAVAAMTNLVGAFPPAQAQRLKWGVGIFRVVESMDLLSLSGAASVEGRQVTSLQHAWHDPAIEQLVGHHIPQAAPRVLEVVPAPAVSHRPAATPAPMRQSLGLPIWVIGLIVLAVVVIAVLTWPRGEIDTEPIAQPAATVVLPEPVQSVTVDAVTPETKLPRIAFNSLAVEEIAKEELLAEDPVVDSANGDAPLNPNSGATPEQPDGIVEPSPRVSEEIETPSPPELTPPEPPMTDSQFARSLQDISDLLEVTANHVARGGDLNADACSSKHLRGIIKELAIDAHFFKKDTACTPAAKEEADRLCEAFEGIESFRKAWSIAASERMRAFVSLQSTNAFLDAIAPEDRYAWRLNVPHRLNQIKAFRSKLVCLGYLAKNLKDTWELPKNRSLADALVWLDTVLPDRCSERGTWKAMDYDGMMRPDQSLPIMEVNRSSSALLEALVP